MDPLHEWLERLAANEDVREVPDRDRTLA